MASGSAHGNGASRLLAAVLLSASLGLMAAGTIGRAQNYDESANLHLSWLISRGQRPWGDFFHNHPDVHLALLAPLYRWLDPEVATYRAGKVVAIVYGALVVLAAMAWAGIAHRSRGAALWAGALVASHGALAYNLAEVRGEVVGAALLALGWAAAGSGRPGWAGLLAGAAACQNQKIGFFAPFVVLAAVLEASKGHRAPPGVERPVSGRGGPAAQARTVRPLEALARATLGVVALPALLACGLLALGTAGPFIRWTLATAWALGADVSPGRNLAILHDLLVASPVLPLAALARLAAGAPVSGRPAVALALVSAFAYVGVSPYKNIYNLAHAVVAMSVAAAGFVDAAVGGARGRLAGHAVLAYVFVFHGLIAGAERWRLSTSGEAARQWEAVVGVASRIGPDELVLDGQGALGRNGPIPFVQLAANVTRIARRQPGLIGSVASALARTGCRYVVVDASTRALDEVSVRFIEAFYLPVCGRLATRGVRVPGAGRRGGATASIGVPGEYLVLGAGGRPVAAIVDGRTIDRGRLWLSLGAHHVRAEGPVELRADPPWPGLEPWSLPGLAAP